jgi:hypothetical protein
LLADRNYQMPVERLIFAMIEFHGLGFTIHEFTYHYRLPDSQKRKLIAALEEVLIIVKIDLRAG